MPDTWREQVDIARAIKGILNSYPSNSILREIIQNSDDAGATKQVFILDHRQHGIDSVIENALKRSQGPALLAINDSVFNDKDWVAVRTMNASSKTEDEAKTGKYGLGIRACYHVTDNMHILSKDTLAISDPHNEFERFPGGVNISLKAEQDHYQDQVLAFSAALGHIPSYAEATVVRLPLRTPAEASRSRINSLAVSISHIQALYRSFIENELSVALLFLKHVMSIELREIDENGMDMLIAKATISNSEVAPLRSFVPGHDDCTQNYSLEILTTARNANPVSENWRITHLVLSEGSVKQLMKGHLGYDVGDRLHEDKLSSHIALAFPLSGQTVQGRLFTLLPLPISTGLPLHMNGIFALTPDRQSLRNPEELGIGVESRERFLVTWNRMIFENLLPGAWLFLLRTLVHNDAVTDWSAWPPHNPLLPLAGSVLSGFVDLALTQEIADVFPAQVEGKSCIVGPTLPALITEAFSDQKLVQAVSTAGVPVVSAPSHIFEVIKRAGLKGPKCSFRFFDAQIVSILLQQKIAGLQALQDVDKDCILGYLICASSSYISGLPLIPTVDGARISLFRPTSRSKRYTLANAAEVNLFGSCDSNMINIYNLSDDVRERLQQCSTSQELNVVQLGPDNMKGYLMRIVGVHHINEQLCLDKPLPDISWFSAFWMWMDSLDDREAFFAIASAFHLLPMLNNSIRHVSKKGFLIPQGREDLFEVLRAAGVPFLNRSISSTNTLSDYGKISSVDNFLELISFIRPDEVEKPQDRLVLQKHFVKCLEKGKTPALNSMQRASFCALPVFPIRVSNLPDPLTELDSAIGHVQFIDVDDSFPLPILENVLFIDMSKSSKVLGLALQPNAFALKELELMKVSIENLSKQPHALQDLLMKRIVTRLLDLTEETRETLRTQKFVPAVNSIERISPADIIDPNNSALTNLFKGEKGRFPMKPYNSFTYLGMMRTAKLICTELSSTMLEERIQYLSSNVSDPVRFEKAKILLRLLSAQWHASFHQVLQTNIQTAWIPVSTGTLMSGQLCRDVKTNEHHFLFDLVLSRVSSIVTDDIRKALGWATSLGFDVLLPQFQLTLDHLELPDRPKRLLRLIQYIATQYSTEVLTLDELRPLQDIIQNRDWIPLSDFRLAQSKHTLLTSGLRIGNTFQCIPTALRNKDCVNFLRVMGCSDRPTVDALIEALSESADLTEAVSLLTELSSHKDIAVHQRCHILVPNQDCILHKLPEVYFNDMGDSSDVTLKDELLPVHSAISKLVAQGLGIPFFSSLRLDDDDDLDIDDEDMSESLITRIKNVLIEYDVQYSFNEFLANAADAGASHFGVILDTQRFQSTHILCPEMEVFQRGPAMVLSNNGTFSEDDFKGIRNVGKGGKQNIGGAIGKFGLGALSFYQFTEVAFIISGEYVMILNPGGNYLPKHRGHKRRSLWRKLKDFRRKFADHLLPFNGIFGYSSNMDSYPGTLIRLPLRLDGYSSRLSNIVTLSDCRDLLMGPYQDLSQTALFFTPLRRISAEERQKNGIVKKLWLICGESTPSAKPVDDGGAEEFLLTIKWTTNEASRRQQWLIINDSVPLSNVPVPLLSVVQHLKALDGINISVAFCLNDQRPLGQYHLFSGLQLPEELSLPAHINAAFAVASDRRRIQFDPPDGSGRRPLQATYNAWLLSDAIPPLYLHGLECLLYNKHRQGNVIQFWPRKAQGLVSEEVTKAVYASLPVTDLCVFSTVTGIPIAPKDAIISAGEPELVRVLLTRLKISNYVVLEAKITSLLPKDQLPMLNVDSLTGVINQTDVVERLQKLFQRYMRMRSLAQFQSLLHRSGIIPMVDETISFLIAGKSAKGHTLPLLITKDLVLRHFDDNPPTYHFPNEIPESLFPHSKFLSNELSSSTQKLLSSPLYRVEDFDGPAVLKFVVHHVGPPSNTSEHSEDTIKWIALFWQNFEKLPADLKLEQLSEYPLFATFEESIFVSLKHCRSGCVLPDPKIDELRDIMHHLDIPVLQDHGVLTDDKCLKFSFKSFLECLLQKGGDPFEGLDNNLAEWLAKWVVKQMRFGLQNLSPAQRSLLERLPLWEATRHGYIQRLSAKDVHQLPSDVQLSMVKRYLDPNRSIAQYAIELETLWSIQHDQRLHRHWSEAYAEFSQMLDLPDSISKHDLADYEYLLGKLIGVKPPNLKLPDRRLRLRSPGDLFDCTSELFMAAFHRTQDEMFVHPRFSSFQRSLKVTTSVTFKIFRRCAQAIHTDHWLKYYQNHNLLTRARTVYQYYNDELTREVMANQRLWNDLSHFYFIPCTAASDDISYDMYPSLAGHHDAVLASPNMLLREGFQHLAWTQRARFEIEPSTNLIAVHPDIGVPTAEEVVSHLVILATQVSKDHVHNQMLTRDLKLIYNWLQDNCYNAATALKRRQNDKIFLNVDNIEDKHESWQWCSSQELVLNLSYDSQRCFKIAPFLLKYQELLVTAGVRRRVDVTHEDESQFGDSRFERLRARGKLLDIELQPEYSQGDEIVDSLRLKAHGAFLAAHIPHIEEALSGGWNEAESRILSFPGTFFGACAFLDILYTGDIRDERPQEDESAMLLLKNLLEMLPIAHEWDLPALKKKLGWLITVKYLFIQPETLEMIQREAEEHDATELVQACIDFAQKNATILEDFVES